MQTVKATLVLLMCFLLLVGCGLKGPLYLPAETPAAQPATQPATEQAPEQSAVDAEERGDPDEKEKDFS